MKAPDLRIATAAINSYWWNVRWVWWYCLKISCTHLLYYPMASRIDTCSPKSCGLTMSCVGWQYFGYTLWARAAALSVAVAVFGLFLLRGPWRRKVWCLFATIWYLWTIRRRYNCGNTSSITVLCINSTCWVCHPLGCESWIFFVRLIK